MAPMEKCNALDMNFEQHILHQLLHTQCSHHYNLRPRPHNLSLSYAMGLVTSDLD